MRACLKGKEGHKVFSAGFKLSFTINVLGFGAEREREGEKGNCNAES